MTLPYLVCAGVTALSAAISLGFSIAAVVTSRGDLRTAPLYTTARSFALLAASLLPIVIPALGWLQAMAVAMIVVQIGDGFIGLRIKDLMKTVGPFGTAIVNAAALYWMMAGR